MKLRQLQTSRPKIDSSRPSPGKSRTRTPFPLLRNGSKKLHGKLCSIIFPIAYHFEMYGGGRVQNKTEHCLHRGDLGWEEWAGHSHHTNGDIRQSDWEKAEDMDFLVG